MMYMKCESNDVEQTMYLHYNVRSLPQVRQWKHPLLGRSMNKIKAYEKGGNYLKWIMEIKHTRPKEK
jgi:hypothetical protein